MCWRICRCILFMGRSRRGIEVLLGGKGREVPCSGRGRLFVLVVGWEGLVLRVLWRDDTTVVVVAAVVAWQRGVWMRDVYRPTCTCVWCLEISRSGLGSSSAGFLALEMG